VGPQLFLTPLALGDVRKEALQALDTVPGKSSHRPCPHPNPPSVFAPPPVLHLARLLVAKGGLQGPFHRRHIIRVHRGKENPQAALANLLRRKSAEPLDIGTDEDDIAS